MKPVLKLVLGLSFFLLSSLVFAAGKVSMFENADALTTPNTSLIPMLQVYDGYTNRPSSLAKKIHQKFKLDRQTQLIPFAIRNDANKQSFSFQLSYYGIPVWNHDIVIVMDADGQVIQGYGDVITDISGDISDMLFLSEHQRWQWFDRFVDQQYTDVERVFRSKETEQVIYVDDNSRARNALKISFFTDVVRGNSHPEEIMAFIDINTQAVIKILNVLAHANEVDGSGPSGDKKIRHDHLQSGASQTPPTTLVVLQ